MKIQIICPYCECEEFEIEYDMFACETCGELLSTDEVNYKKIEEN